MFDRSLRVRSVLSVGAAVAALAIAVPLAVAGGPLFIPHAQTGQGLSPVIRDKLGEIGAWAVPSATSRERATRPGEGLSGADRAWLSPGQAASSLRQTAPRLGEGLTGVDRSWLAPTATEPRVAAPRVAPPSSGFDWGDAGIGAGAAAAILLVATGSAVAIRRRVTPAH